MNNIAQGGIARQITNVVNVTELAQKASIEIDTLTKVIAFLTNEVELAGDRLDLEKERNFKKKIHERFGEFEGSIRSEYALLLPDYADKYSLSWQACDVSEECRDQVDRLLSIKSLRFLERTSGNPLEAIDLITEWLKTEIGKNHTNNGDGFSELAIRFFVYKEFARCNVFPNLV